ncbi:MAG TPA: aminotransferase class I/II-fold pyridoxal phosphate-dependent enzyme [Candidatus Limnocylindrales bacterium]|jgi:aspartate aminotransferase
MITIRQTDRLRDAVAPFMRFFSGAYAELAGAPGVANFAVGNPHELALPAYVDALARHLPPQDADWFAYKMSEPNAREVVARSLGELTGLDWDPLDIQMTNGGFAAIAVALRMLLEPGDEAVYLSPPWFFYEQLILAADGLPVRVPLTPPRFELELAKIEAAITPRTRVVMLNSPHNPSGRVYPLADLRRLADLLERAGARIGRPIYLLSDEPYRRILFDDVRFHSPAEAYPHTIVTYSYGKQLLAPGMRIGYLTWPPTLPAAERERLRDDAFVHQCAAGYLFPNADLQHALADLEPLLIDMSQMQRRRDRMVAELGAMGYQPTTPEGTFYILARSPLPDDEAFCRILNRHRILVLPGTIVELPGWFRISLTASDEMVERGLPGFRAAMAEAVGGLTTGVERG